MGMECKSEIFLPCHDVLAVVVSQVNFSHTTDGNSLGLSVICLDHIRDCWILEPYIGY